MSDRGRGADGLQVRNVLVPLDGSDSALRAVATGHELANRFKAELHTISLARSREELERLSSLVPSSLRAYPGDKHVRVQIGADPAAAIARRASELDPSIVCLTTQGRGRLAGSVTGSVARSVMEQATVPIVALGPVADRSWLSPPPTSWPKPLEVSRIVACVDGTQTSEEVLPMATAWALALGMSLTILTVVGHGPEPTWRDEQRGRYGHHAEPESYIESLVQRWAEVLPATDGVVARDPIGVANGIRIHLDRRPAGLVAMTTHARSGMQRMRFGARAANIVRASVAPCLVARVAGSGPNIVPNTTRPDGDAEIPIR